MYPSDPEAQLRFLHRVITETTLRLQEQSTRAQRLVRTAEAWLDRNAAPRPRIAEPEAEETPE